MTPHYVARPTKRIAYYRCTATFRLGWKACGIKQVNAERIEKWMGELIATLATSQALVDDAVAKANDARGADAEPLREQQAILRARIRDLDQRIDNLVEVLASNGAAALTSIEGKLRETERDKLIAVADVAEVSERLREVSRSHVDDERVRSVLGDLRLLYDLATGQERGELLRLLVKRITFRGADEPAGVEFFDQEPAVLTLGGGGSKIRTERLPKRVSNKNFETCIVIDLAAARKRRDSRESGLMPRPRVLELLDLADEFQEALDTGSVNNRAALARLHGISRARVTQIMALLRLHPDLVHFVRASTTLGMRAPSERQLRPLTGRPALLQLAEARRLFPAFRAFPGGAMVGAGGETSSSAG